MAGSSRPAVRATHPDLADIWSLNHEPDQPTTSSRRPQFIVVPFPICMQLQCPLCLPHTRNRTRINSEKSGKYEGGRGSKYIALGVFGFVAFIDFAMTKGGGDNDLERKGTGIWAHHYWQCCNGSCTPFLGERIYLSD